MSYSVNRYDNYQCGVGNANKYGTFKYGDCVMIDRDDEGRSMIVYPRPTHDGFIVYVYPDDKCMMPPTDEQNFLETSHCLNGLNNSYHISHAGGLTCPKWVNLTQSTTGCIPTEWGSILPMSIDRATKYVSGKVFLDNNCTEYNGYETFESNICVGNIYG